MLVMEKCSFCTVCTAGVLGNLSFRHITGDTLKGIGRCFLSQFKANKSLHEIMPHPVLGLQWVNLTKTLNSLPHDLCI